MALPLKLNPEILRHCENKKQTEVVEAVIKHGSVKAASMALGTTERWLFTILSRARRNAEKAGILSSETASQAAPSKEIKPKKKTTVAKNVKKFAAASAYCLKNSLTFVVVTEVDLKALGLMK